MKCFINTDVTLSSLLLFILCPSHIQIYILLAEKTGHICKRAHAKCKYVL